MINIRALAGLVAVAFSAMVPVAARSDAATNPCPRRTTPGTTEVWFNRQDGAVAANLARTVCTAAPHSSVTLASMYIFGGSKSADSIVNALRYVAVHRGVHVHVVVTKSQFPTKSAPREWTYRQFAAKFSFADLHPCDSGCTVTGDGMYGNGTYMHSKWLTISRTTFGGPVVVESTLNLAPQQYDGQVGHALYFYGNRALHAAFYSQFVRYEHRVASNSDAARWLPAGAHVRYAFDPASVSADPIATELERVTCRHGDYVDVVNANVTRGRLVSDLNAIRESGCAVRVLTQGTYRDPNATFSARHGTEHDKFVLISAHTSTGAVRAEVISGSEDFRPYSMVDADEQLVVVDDSAVVQRFRTWFTEQYRAAAA